VPLTVLHTNDFHGRLDEGLAMRLREWKGDGVYFDSGDCIKAGNLALPLGPEKAWHWLDVAGCDASVLGNRETHVLPTAFRAKIAGHRHPILCANLTDRAGSRVLPGTLILERAGLVIGVFGVMVPMVTARMKTQAASAYLWTDPIEAAAGCVADLRDRCDLVIALTHIGHAQDELLAARVSGIDVILGGHSHTVLHAPQRVGDTWICQGGSHGRFAGRYVWDGTLTGQLVSL
jgi:2',3'-cyclic-nucleotide 2'-phosphodiesterase (5'-nucleotidase family)